MKSCLIFEVEYHTNSIIKLIIIHLLKPPLSLIHISLQKPVHFIPLSQISRIILLFYRHFIHKPIGYFELSFSHNIYPWGGILIRICTPFAIEYQDKKEKEAPCKFCWPAPRSMRNMLKVQNKLALMCRCCEGVNRFSMGKHQDENTSPTYLYRENGKKDHESKVVQKNAIPSRPRWENFLLCLLLTFSTQWRRYWKSFPTKFAIIDSRSYPPVTFLPKRYMGENFKCKVPLLWETL